MSGNSRPDFRETVQTWMVVGRSSAELRVRTICAFAMRNAFLAASVHSADSFSCPAWPWASSCGNAIVVEHSGDLCWCEVFQILLRDGVSRLEIPWHFLVSHWWFSRPFCCVFVLSLRPGRRWLGVHIEMVLSCARNTFSCCSSVQWLPSRASVSRRLPISLLPYQTIDCHHVRGSI